MVELHAVEDESAPDPRPTLALELDAHRLSVGPTEVRLQWRLDLRNDSADHILALRVWSDMTTARRYVEDGQLSFRFAEDGFQLDRIAKLAPGETASASGEWRMPVGSFPPEPGTQTVLIRPAARFRIIGAGLPPARAAFLIGQPTADAAGRMKPIRLDAGPAIYRDCVSRPVA